jgi:hypothetical protein
MIYLKRFYRPGEWFVLENVVSAVLWFVVNMLCESWIACIVIGTTVIF